jgi:hypothetical protein
MLCPLFLVRPPRVADSYKCRPFSKMNSLLKQSECRNFQIQICHATDLAFEVFPTLAYLFEARAQCYFDGFKNYK